MIHGEWKTATIALNGTLSAEVDIGRQYERLLIVIPTIDSAQISLQVAEKTGGIFQDLHTTDAGGNKQVITVSITGGITWEAPLGGFQFIKVKASAAQAGGARSFRLCGVRS